MRVVPAVATLAVLSAWLSAPLPAHACSGDAALHRRLVQPADGAEGIPVNTEIRIQYTGASAPEVRTGLEGLAVRPVGGGDPIELTVETRPSDEGVVVVARPTAPLAVGAAYEILDRLADEWCVSDPCLSEPAVVATFTTSDVEDLVAPAFGGLVEVSASADECDSSACCGPYSVVSHGFGWEPANDDGPADQIRYNVYGPGGSLVAALVSSARGYETCAGAPTGDDEIGHFQVGPGEWSVRAVDLAGNEDDNEIVVQVEATCAQVEEPPILEDAGVCEAGMDGDDLADDEPARNGSGCSVVASAPAASDRSSSLIALGLAIFGLATLRTRRS